jgi:murein DD-endopeptidase MepM/ murein hydrolase activator NlpD
MVFPKLQLPMRTTHIGYRHGQINAEGLPHPGFDFNFGKTPNGDQNRVILARMDFEIVLATRRSAYGRTIVAVNHDLELAFRFMHLNHISVAEGDWVKSGQKLGNSGADSLGYYPNMTAHLHHDILRVQAVEQYGFNWLTWKSSLRNKQVFEDVYVDPSHLYPALKTLLLVRQPWAYHGKEYL